MSVIRKLHIQGIRSFSPQEGKVMEFHTPITLIVGQNGCGKTTIIEALKFAITNSAPPGTDGGRAFVHDPKIGSGFEVSGLVKLDVTSVSGAKVQATRRVKLTRQKNKQVKFQTLEGTIRLKKKDGTWQDMSSKCVDSKLEMCRHMGVSEAILNFVILCHQEESCWPLDEAKKVKERFDLIFNTAGYTTALKLLDDKDKQLVTRARQENDLLKYAETNMNMYLQKKEQKEQEEVQLAALEDGQKKIDEQIKKVEEELKKLEEIEAERAKFEGEVSGLKVKVKAEDDTIVDLKRRIGREIFQGDADELATEIEDFEANAAKKEKELKKRESSLESAEIDLDDNRKIEQKLLVQEGQFQQHELENMDRIEQLKVIGDKVAKLIRKLKDDSPSDCNFTPAAMGVAETFLQIHADDRDSLTSDIIAKAVNCLIRAKDSELTKTRTALESEESEFQHKIDHLRANRTRLEAEKTMKLNLMADNKKAVEDLRKRLNAIEGSHDKLAFLDDEEGEVQEKISVIEKSGLIIKYENDIAQISEEIKKLEAKVGDARVKVEMLGKDKMTTDQIATYNKQKVEKRRDCNEIMRRIEEQLKSLLETVPPENVGAALEKKKNLLKTELDNKQKTKSDKDKELSKHEAELGQINRELRRKERLIEDWKNQTAEIVEEGDFHETLETLKKTLDDTQKNSYYGEAAVWLNKKFIQSMKKKPQCPVCKKSFHGDECNNTQEGLLKKVQEIQQSLPETQRELEEIKKKYETYLGLKPAWDENSRMEREDIPSMKDKKRQIQGTIEKLKGELEDLNEIIMFTSSDLTMAQNLTKDVVLYDQNMKEMQNFEVKIEKLEQGRNPAAVACKDTFVDSQAELESLQNTISTKRLEKDNKDMLRSKKREELQELRTEKNRIQEEKLKITSEMQNREALETQKREAEESSKTCQDSIVTIDEQLPALKAEIREAESAKSKFMKTKETKLQDIRGEMEHFRDFLKSIEELKQKFLKFEKEKNQFEAIQKKIDNIGKKIEKAVVEIANMREEIGKLKEELADQKIRKQILLDNKSLLEKQERVEKLRTKLGEMEQQLKKAQESGGVGSRKRKLQADYSNLFSRYSRDKGRVIELRRTIAGIAKELKDTFKNTEADYIERLARKTVLERALVDVRRYKKALDHAILTFHKKRMENINKSLKKYWQQVYKGNDIDMIQIRTSDEDASDESKKKVNLETKSRKNYCYRVVMIRRGVELDMRGRCSAGQKVLAATLIRIALAEAFSSKCGVIALDEPTTNLDEANITALAACLTQLARRMARTKTFQLIVITHDQEFMERLIEIDCIEHYYRIKRDNLGFSTIVQTPK